MSQQTMYRQDIVVNAPLDHVWQLVATEEGLRQWWGNTIYLEAKEGGRCEEWRASGQQMVHWQGVVTLYAPPHELLMTLHSQDKPTTAPELTTISIALKSEGAQTRVHVTQRSFGPTTAITTSPVPNTITPSTYPTMPMSQLNQRPPNQPSKNVSPSMPPNIVYQAPRDHTFVPQIQQSLQQSLQQLWQQRIHQLLQQLASSLNT